MSQSKSRTHKKVMVVVPASKQDISTVTAKTLINAQASKGASVRYQISILSLLARNFNHLFCNAYKAKFDYIIYVHSDLGVESAPGHLWVETMLQAMEAYKFAALSQVVPIKSDLGVTTTALQLKKDNKHGLRRLTVKELGEHTGVITRSDLCTVFKVSPDDAGALLINTGLLCMDLQNFDWTQWNGFSIYDQILWNKSGTPKAFTIPEDWRLSQFLHEYKWPYGAINCLEVNHDGQRFYNNREDYGEEHDQTAIQPSEKFYLESTDAEADKIADG